MRMTPKVPLTIVTVEVTADVLAKMGARCMDLLGVDPEICETLTKGAQAFKDLYQNNEYVQIAVNKGLETLFHGNLPVIIVTGAAACATVYFIYKAYKEYNEGNLLFTTYAGVTVFAPVFTTGAMLLAGCSVPVAGVVGVITFATLFAIGVGIKGEFDKNAEIKQLSEENAKLNMKNQQAEEKVKQLEQGGTQIRFKVTENGNEYEVDPLTMPYRGVIKAY